MGFRPAGAQRSSTTVPGGGGAHSSGDGPRDGGAERDPTCCVYPYLTLPYLTHPPSQHRTNPHDAVPDALSPVRGPLGDTITSHPSTHAWRAADAGRVPKRVRILQPDLSLEAWGWQPWVGAA